MTRIAKCAGVARNRHSVREPRPTRPTAFHLYQNRSSLNSGYVATFSRGSTIAAVGLAWSAIPSKAGWFNPHLIIEI
jgi:hypothetical protein